MIIVNADDFGKDEPTTLAIAESFKRGYIDQTTLMVGEPWAERAVEIAFREGFAGKVGLHLNLTEGHALAAEMRQNESFSNADGVMDKRGGKARHHFTPYCGGERAALLSEIDAQAKKYREFRLSLLHCDSHHHMHWCLPILALTLPILQRYGFKSMRAPLDVLESGFGSYVRRIRNMIVRFHVGSYGLTMTGSFGTAEMFKDRWQKMPKGHDVELMVHPAFDKQGRLINITRYDSGVGPLMSEYVKLIPHG